MYEGIKMRKLPHVSVSEKVQKAIAGKLKPLDTRKLSVKGEWQTFRYKLHVKKSVGTRKKRRGPKKATALWSFTVKEAISVKRKLFKGCLNLQQ